VTVVPVEFISCVALEVDHDAVHHPFVEELRFLAANGSDDLERKLNVRALVAENPIRAFRKAVKQSTRTKKIYVGRERCRFPSHGATIPLNVAMAEKKKAEGLKIPDVVIVDARKVESTSKR
jgi:hypothetical protein